MKSLADFSITQSRTVGGYFYPNFTLLSLSRTGVLVLFKHSENLALSYEEGLTEWGYIQLQNVLSREFLNGIGCKPKVPTVNCHSILFYI